MQRGGFLLRLLLLGVCVDRCAACGGGDLAGAVIGTFLACCVIFAVILFLLFKKGIIKRGDGTGKAQKAGSAAGASYTNPAFHGDEAGAAAARPASLSRAEQGIGGYVPCAEYESPTKDASTRTSVQPNGGVSKTSSWTPNFRGPGQSMAMAAKSSSHGSHGSLDDTFVTNEPEVVSVSLQSQDFIGLGFNIWGSMRDGVFVSQVHNRGPAIETGKIKPGDRIMDITISFENMVYEDALTILSYASPYPVRLTLQKPDRGRGGLGGASDGLDTGAALGEHVGDDTDPDDTVHHPVYRSQSMDDVSKIQKERFSFRMRRARSEMKRGSSKKNEAVAGADSGTLRKWKDMVGLESSGPAADVSVASTSNEPSFSFPDMKLNADDMFEDVKTEATVHTFQSPRVLEVNIPDQNKSVAADMNDDERAKIERLRAEIQQEWNAAPEELVGKSSKSPAPQPAKLRFGDSDEEDNGVGLNAQGKLVLTDAPPHDDDDQPSGGVFSRKRRDSSGSSRSRSSDEDVGNEIDNDFLMRALKLSEPDSQLVPDIGEEVVIGNEKDESIIKLSAATPPAAATVRDRHGSASSSDSDSGKRGQQLKFSSGVVPMSESVHLGSNINNSSSAPADHTGPSYDEANASMIVNFSEKSLLMKDDPEVPVETDDSKVTKGSRTSDDEEMRMLKDYLGDRPFLVDNLDSSDDEQKTKKSSGMKITKTVTVSKVGSDGTITETRTETLETSDPQSHAATTTSSTTTAGAAGLNMNSSDLSQLKAKALSDAKREIRRRSDSENENQKSSGGSSLSSRSASPQHPRPIDDLDLDLSALRQKLTMRPREGSDHSDAEQDGGSADKSGSPDIKRRSGGGLTFDITTSEFQSMPDEIEPEPRGEPKGGVAYYVGIDDELRAPKPESSFPGDGDDSILTSAKVRAWGEPDTWPTRRRKSSDSSASSKEGHQGDADPGQITFKLPESSYIEGNNNELDKKHGSVSVDLNGRSSSLDSTPIGSPQKSSSSEAVLSKPDSSSEKFSVTTHDEAKGTYTMSFNSLEDSEA